MNDIPPIPENLSGNHVIPRARWCDRTESWVFNKVSAADGSTDKRSGKPKFVYFASISYDANSMFFRMMSDIDLTGGDYRVWGAFARRMEIGNMCYVTQSEIAKDSGYSAQYVSASTGKLVGKGYLLKFGRAYSMPKELVFRGKWNTFSNLPQPKPKPKPTKESDQL